MFELPRRHVNRLKACRLTIAQNLTGLLAPPVCALCGGAGQRADELWGIDLCGYCEAACPRPLHCCPRCAEPQPADRLCPHCLAQPPPFDVVHALFLYEDPVDRMIMGLKFGHELVYARILGTLLARALRRHAVELPDCILPMPLHRARHLERGFNQAAEIARHAARRLKIPVDTHLLARSRGTAPQSALTAAARAANIAGAFTIRAGRRVPARVALLDDVLTTGATAAAAAQALRAAGAGHVQVWVCARTRRSHDGEAVPGSYGE